jgi:hypothetical protein
LSEFIEESVRVSIEEKEKSVENRSRRESCVLELLRGKKCFVFG